MSDTIITEPVRFLVLNLRAGREEYHPIDRLPLDSFERWVCDRIDASRFRPILATALIEAIKRRKDRHEAAVFMGKVQSITIAIPTLDELEQASVVINFRHATSVVPGLALRENGSYSIYLHPDAMGFVPRFLAQGLTDPSQSDEFIKRVKTELTARELARETWKSEVEKREAARKKAREVEESKKVSATFDDLEDQ